MGNTAPSAGKDRMIFLMDLLKENGWKIFRRNKFHRIYTNEDGNEIKLAIETGNIVGKNEEETERFINELRHK